MCYNARMDNEKKKKRIREWQCSCYVHPLNCTCGYPLRPIEVDDEVVLECLACKKIQKNIPQIVLDTDVEELNKNMENLINGLKNES